MVDQNCENCLNFRIIPKTHRIYIRRPDSKLIVHCSKNILMAYHEYSEGAEKYKTMAGECSSFDNMDETE